MLSVRNKVQYACWFVVILCYAYDYTRKGVTVYDDYVKYRNVYFFMAE